MWKRSKIGEDCMNGNRECCYETEKEIDLLDLIFYLLKRWRSLVVFVAFGALLGCGICILRREAVEMTPEQSVLMGYYEPNDEIKRRMRQAAMYHRLYEEQKEYQQESFVMQMDPNAVYTGEVKYYLAAGTDTRFLGEKFQMALNETGLMSELRRTVGGGKKIQYFREILNSTVSLDNSTVLLNMEEESNENAVITYTVYFGNRNTCEVMLEIIEERVESLADEYRSEYEIDIFEKIDDYVELRVNKDFMTYQRNYTDLTNTYITNWSRLENEFNQNLWDVAYYNLLYLYKDEMEIPEYNPDVRQEIDIKAVIKWVLIGMILTGGLWGVYFIVKYLLDKSIKTTEELKKLYDVPLLGNIVYSTSKRNLIDRILTKWSSNCDMPADSIDYVRDMLCSLGVTRAVICGASENVKERLSGELKTEKIKLFWTEFLHQSSEAFRKALDSDGEILIVETGKTGHQKIKRELEVCCMQNIKVLGILVVGEK